MKARKIITLFSFLMLSSFGLIAQPAWFGGTPTVTPYAFSEDFSYGINQVGKVYVILIIKIAVLPTSAELELPLLQVRQVAEYRTG